MLTIRREQFQAFEQASRERFVDRGAQHVETALPARYRELGREQVRESVRQAMQKADRYGITQEYDVLRLLNCMYVLGFDFDTDRRYPWASETLLDTRLKSGPKMNLLVRLAETA